MTYNRLILIRPPSLQCITVFFSEKAGVVLNKSWNCFYLRSEARERFSLWSINVRTFRYNMLYHAHAPSLPYPFPTYWCYSFLHNWFSLVIITFFPPYFSVILDKIRDFFTLPFPVWRCPGQFTFIVILYIREYIFTIYSCISDTYNIFSFNY